MIDASVFEEIRRADPDGFNRQCASEASAHQYSKLYSLTAKHVPAGARVLDWGCGRGHFSYSLFRSGFRVTAYSLEPPPEIFEGLTPSDRAHLAFVRGGLDEPRRLPFEDGAFDAAFSVGVLEHVRELGGDEAASLAELRRVLAPAASSSATTSRTAGAGSKLRAARSPPPAQRPGPTDSIAGASRAATSSGSAPRRDSASSRSDATAFCRATRSGASRRGCAAPRSSLRPSTPATRSSSASSPRSIRTISSWRSRSGRRSFGVSAAPAAPAPLGRPKGGLACR